MGIRIVPRYQRITLAGEYDGVWLDVRVNPPMRVYDEFMSAKDLDQMTRLLASLTQGSNVENEDGSPLDLTVTAGWTAVPKQFLEPAVEALMAAIKGPKVTPERPSSGATSATAEPPPSSTP